ncbi:MAG: hypothetical protein PF485_10585 [Bacteroidales bacterium]|jgi:hypothetical protein|nr:hypothetical protein [Bacteroidales bacterium]
MKSKNVLKSITLFAIVMFFVCTTLEVNAQIPVETPSARVMAKRFLKYGKVEVIESNMEKIEGASDEYGGIKITGKAKYTPARIGKKPFKDLQYIVRFDLFNDAGLKVMKVEGIPDCGENGQAENVEYKEPFPFVFEDNLIALDKYGKISSQKLSRWYILQ